MDYVIRLRRPRAAVILPLLLGLTLAAATACDDQRIPTSPPVAARITPQAVIVANVTVLPTLGGTWTFAQDINDKGQVVGMSYLAGDTIYHAFLWTPGQGIQDLGTLGGLTSTANAINELGQVVGESWTPSRGRAFLWTAGLGMQNLGTLGGTYSAATDINDAGQVVGYTGWADAQVYNERAFLWTPAGGMQDLGSLGGVFTRAEAINNAGQVVGESQTRRTYHAFLWMAATGMRDLGTFPGPDGVASFAADINDAGQVVGMGNVDVWGLPNHPFLWTPDHGMQDLGTLGSEVFSSGATGINDLGDVVGGAGGLPFIWTSANGIEDLHVMTGFNTASAINNHGQVVSGNRIVTIGVTVPNRAPVAVTAGPYTGIEGSAVTLGLSATDADGDVLTYAWDLGDGTAGSGAPPPSSHIYADNGTYGVRLTVSDGRGGTDTRTTTATIANVAPAILSGGLTGPVAPIRLVAGGAAAPITVAFVDPAGQRDAYSALIQCGNGVTLAPIATPSPYTATCHYTSAGVYTVRATVFDEDGGTSTPAFYRYVVIYDPEGGFTTGTGFYGVPGGNRKAHFTFTAKFLPGRPTAPNGTARFWIPGDQVDFESTAIEMLVIAGNRAQFWGTGMFNGAPARFRITVVDGNHGTANVDAFRLELWRDGILVFDTQPGAAQDAPVTTAIDGGNIQIHSE